MKDDIGSNPDVCRTIPHTAKPEALDIIKQIKLNTNTLINLCKIEATRQEPSEVSRLMYNAASAYEEAAMWAVKGLTSEDWRKP